MQGAYSTEVLRGAILAIPQGQIEAARAYGMSPGLLLRRITLPAMLPFAIPGLANLWLIATKDTALLAIVGVNELTQVTRNAGGATKAYFTFFIAAGAMYLALTLVSECHHRAHRAPGAARHARHGGGALMAEHRAQHDAAPARPRLAAAAPHRADRHRAGDRRRLRLLHALGLAAELCRARRCRASGARSGCWS